MENYLHLYAHRGLHHKFPENTIPAFAQALEAGATHLEMDLRSSLEKKIFVFHDATGERLCGEKKLLQKTSAQEIASWTFLEKHSQNTHISLFEEVLERFPHVPFSVDIKDKDPEIVEKVVNLIHKKNEAKRICLVSFEHLVIKTLRKLSYKGDIGSSRYIIFRLKVFPYFFSTESHSVQVPPSWKGLRFACPSFIERCHSLKKRVDFWTINDPEEALALLRLGADGIITDEVLKIKSIFFEFAQKNKRKVYESLI